MHPTWQPYSHSLAIKLKGATLPHSGKLSRTVPSTLVLISPQITELDSSFYMKAEHVEQGLEALWGGGRPPSVATVSPLWIKIVLYAGQVIGLTR